MIGGDNILGERTASSTEGRARRRTADLSLSLYDIPVLPRRTERPSLLLNVDEDPVPTFRERQLTMLKHALSKRTIRCTIQTALLYLVPTLAMCSVAYALGRAGVSHHRERDIHALNALTSSIDAGNVSATIILMKEELDLMRNSTSRWAWLLRACLGACVTTWLAVILLVQSKLRFQQALLRRVLPSKTIPYIEAGRDFCEHFEAVTVLFADIKSFTTIAAEMEPLVVVNMLNDLYKTFDAMTKIHGVYKVETIGDAFMCAGGVPDALEPVEGARRAADMALAMIESMKSFKTAAGRSLEIRVGLHTGPLIGTVTGKEVMPHYCLIGDTVNTAARMETTGEPSKIHVSNATAVLLQHANNLAFPKKHYELDCRGLVDVKGKGRMTTYWLSHAGGSVSDRRVDYSSYLAPRAQSSQPADGQEHPYTEVARGHSSRRLSYTSVEPCSVASA